LEGAVGEDRLVSRARRGDAAAFTELVRRHDARLRDLAFHVLGDRDLIDDAMQELYVKAFRALPGFQGRASVATWLHRLTYNACIDELRRSRRQSSAASLHEIPEPSAATPDPSETFSGPDELRAALLEMPPDQRAAVWLVDAMGFDYSEAAEIMATPMGTLASRLNRARTALRRTLAPPELETER
jgi:RNA polymerase sigma-70 factor (ECF subfamily)